MSTCKEKPVGRRFSRTEGEVPYKLIGYPSHKLALAALLATSPASEIVADGFGAMPRNDKACSVTATFINDTMPTGNWDGIALYAYATPKPVGEKVLSFSIGRQSANLTKAIASVYFSKAKPSGINYPARVIGYDKNSGSVNGVDITYPVTSFSVEYYVSKAQFTPAYLTRLQAMAEKPLNLTNTTVTGIATFGPGQLFFEGFDSSIRSKEDDWAVKVAFKAAGTKLVKVRFYGNSADTDIAVPGFSGFDVRHVDVTDADGVPDTAIVYALVHELYESSVFNFEP